MAVEKMGATMLGALKVQGFDIRKPYMFDFYFYLPTQTDAESLALDLRSQGYKAEVEPSADSESILCLATAVLAPNETAMNKLGDKFNALAIRYNGEFDGWETQVD